VTGAGKYHPATSTPSFVEQVVWALQTPSTELNWLLSQPPFFMATHTLPQTASRLSNKSGSIIVP